MIERVPPYEESEAEKLSRAYLNYLSPDPASSAIRSQYRQFPGTVDLTVIIPCYNAETTLAPCVDSVLSQPVTHSMEILLVNDGSTDATAAILDQYRTAGNVTILTQENRGAACARNAALDIARGKYIFFLDADDLLPDNCLDSLLTAALAQNADLIEGGMQTVLPDTAPGVTSATDRHEHPACVPADPFSLSGYVCGKLYRNSLFAKIDFPAGYWFEDSVISWLVFPQTTRVFRWSGEVYRYRMNAGGSSAAARAGSPKTVDTWWITEQLYKDYHMLRLATTSAFYESVLRQITLNHIRCTALTEEARVAVFRLTQAWFVRSFDGFTSCHDPLRIVEKALRLGEYTLYARACTAAWQAQANA